jgi:hypothetical protein
MVFLILLAVQLAGLVIVLSRLCKGLRAANIAVIGVLLWASIAMSAGSLVLSDFVGWKRRDREVRATVVANGLVPAAHGVEWIEKQGRWFAETRYAAPEGAVPARDAITSIRRPHFNPEWRMYVILGPLSGLANLIMAFVCLWIWKSVQTAKWRWRSEFRMGA